MQGNVVSPVKLVLSVLFEQRVELNVVDLVEALIEALELELIVGANAHVVGNFQGHAEESCARRGLKDDPGRTGGASLLVLEVDHFLVVDYAEEAHEGVDHEVDGEVVALVETLSSELVVSVEEGDQLHLHHDLEEDDLEDLVVGLALARVHQEALLLAPLLQPLEAPQDQGVLVHDHLDDLVLQHEALVEGLAVHQVQVEALVGVEEQQPRKLCLLQEVDD